MIRISVLTEYRSKHVHSVAARLSVRTKASFTRARSMGQGMCAFMEDFPSIVETVGGFVNCIYSKLKDRCHKYTVNLKRDPRTGSGNNTRMK